jgi:hypothetical protein
MRRHAEQSANGNHTGTTDTIEQDVVRLPQAGSCGSGKAPKSSFFAVPVFDLRSLPPSTDKAGAKAFDAGIIFIAGRLIDHTFTAEFCFQRHQRGTVGLHAAITTAFTYGVVDKQTLIRVGNSPFCGGAVFRRQV